MMMEVWEEEVDKLLEEYFYFFIFMISYPDAKQFYE